MLKFHLLSAFLFIFCSIGTFAGRLPFNLYIFPLIVIWLANFALLVCAGYSCSHYIKTTHTMNNFKILNLFIAWAFIGIIRGLFEGENYFHYKNLISNSFNILLPLLTYLFYSPPLLQYLLRQWMKWCLLFYFLLFLWFCNGGVHHFYLGPALIMAIFIPILPIKWKCILGSLLIITLLIDFGARSQVIKSAFIILLIVIYYSKKYLKQILITKIIKIFQAFFFIIPIILLYLGISNSYNVFKDDIFTDKVSASTNFTTEDTRSGLYEEIIESAIKNEYVLFGRTPARGNDTFLFQYPVQDMKMNNPERNMNEMCHPNIFTWLGLIGVTLYSIIYLRSSYLAIYYSNSFYLKIIGIFIAFRWAFGWIEDMNSFNAMSFSIWILISVGLSNSFRRMNDYEIRQWVNNIFNF